VSENCVYAGIAAETLCVSENCVYAGIVAETLCVSENCVYALSSQCHCFARHGVTPDCPQGAYWKKFPGLFSAISGTV